MVFGGWMDALDVSKQIEERDWRIPPWEARIEDQACRYESWGPTNHKRLSNHRFHSEAGATTKPEPKNLKRTLFSFQRSVQSLWFQSKWHKPKKDSKAWLEGHANQPPPQGDDQGIHRSVLKIVTVVDTLRSHRWWISMSCNVPDEVGTEKRDQKAVAVLFSWIWRFFRKPRNETFNPSFHIYSACNANWGFTNENRESEHHPDCASWTSLTWSVPRRFKTSF